MSYSVGPLQARINEAQSTEAAAQALLAELAATKAAVEEQAAALATQQAALERNAAGLAALEGTLAEVASSAGAEAAVGAGELATRQAALRAREGAVVASSHDLSHSVQRVRPGGKRHVFGVMRDAAYPKQSLLVATTSMRALCPAPANLAVHAFEDAVHVSGAARTCFNQIDPRAGDGAAECT